jgi:hypothetical protein
VSKNEVGTFACVLYGLCACCGYSETGSCLVSARATRTYASGRVGMKLKFSASTRPGFYLEGVIIRKCEAALVNQSGMAVTNRYKNPKLSWG